MDALLRFHVALGMRDAAPCNILALGDSITEGGQATARPRRWTARLLAALRAAYPTRNVAGGEGFLPPQWSDTDIALPPPAAVVGSPATDLAFGLGWRCVRLQPGMSVTWTVAGTSADIHYARGSNSGVFSYSVDGGTVLTQATANPAVIDSGVVRVDLGASGPHTLTVAWSSGGMAYIDGVVVYDGDEAAGIRMFEAGRWGYATTSIRTRADQRNATGFYFDERIATVAPALVIIAAGVNDMSTGVDPAVTKANLQAIISHLNTITPAPSICLLGYYQRQGTFAYPWSAYQDAYRAIEASNSRVTFYDHSLRLPSYLADPELMADGVHPTDAGHAYLAECLAGFLAPA